MWPSASAGEQGKASSSILHIFLLSGSIRRLVLPYMTVKLASSNTNTWKTGIGLGERVGRGGGGTMQGWGSTCVAALQSRPSKAQTFWKDYSTPTGYSRLSSSLAHPPVPPLPADVPSCAAGDLPLPPSLR